MKHSEPSNRSPEQPRSLQPSSTVDSILTDAVLEQLKKQSTGGCLLCSLDELDDEDWD